MERQLSVFTAVLGIAACGLNTSYVRVDAERDLRRRASFEMSCPEAQLELTPLTHETAITQAGGSTDAPETMGVSGCSKKGTYVYVSGKGYILNSTSDANTK